MFFFWQVWGEILDRARPGGWHLAGCDSRRGASKYSNSVSFDRDMAEDAAWHHRSTAQPEKKTKRKRTNQKRYAPICHVGHVGHVGDVCHVHAMSKGPVVSQSSESSVSSRRFVGRFWDLLPTATGTAFTAAHPSQVAAKAVTLTLFLFKKMF